jgi:FtsP/CotA-like multicopper oxidase with cupredoxin domain
MNELYASIVLPLAMTVVWIAAGRCAAGMPNTREPRRLKRRSMLLIGLAYVGFALCLLWIGLLAEWAIAYGWGFVEGTLKAVAPATIAAHIAVAAGTLRTLRRAQPARLERLAAEAQPSSRLAVDAAQPDRLAADTAHPFFIVPIHASALCSAMTLFSAAFAQPVDPGILEALLRPAVVAALLLVPVLFAVRRYRAMRSPKYAVPTFGKRLGSSFLAGGATFLLAATLFVAYLTLGGASSKLPEASDMMNHHHLDEGGGSPTLLSGGHAHGGHASGVEVAELTGDLSAPADVRYELVAMRTDVELSSGTVVPAWTYNGEIAPELRAKQGDMVEVTLVNRDIEQGVTVHWHGYNVPNAMDGVPGMTQNAVKPGESFVYKFRANQSGTYWFHSHQLASEQVQKGLFGSLIVEPANETAPADVEMTVINHMWLTSTQGFKTAVGASDEWQTKPVRAGDAVKLRIVNTHLISEKYTLQGTDYRITAIDGVQLQEPEPIPDRTSFRIGSGGRFDVVFTMPDRPVALKVGDDAETAKPGIWFQSAAGQERPAVLPDAGLFDPADYGLPVVNALTEATSFDRRFTMVFGNTLGFYDGRFHFLWTINGEVYPNTPTLVVKEGERVKTTFVNRSMSEHPMHLHGHHMTVLKKNGKRVATPWVTDTLNVLSGETYEVAFVADNPGMWMDHCHILQHAATGMVLHLMYDHVSPSYEAGTRSGNLPE